MEYNYNNVCHAENIIFAGFIEHNVEENIEYDLPCDKPHIDCIENYVVDDGVRSSMRVTYK